MNIKLTALLFAVVSALVASRPTAASADTPFATLDRAGRHGEVGAQLSLGVFDDDGFDTLDGFARFDVHGRFDVAPSLSIYTALALSQLFSEGDDDLGLSNLDLGLHYLVPVGGRSDLVIRGGLLLPTASDGPAAVASNVFSSYTRVTDFAMVIPDSTWARLSLNYLYTSGAVYFQGDFGIDIAVAAEGDNPDPLLHLNGGVGFNLGQVSLAFELANSIFTEGEDNWDTTFSTMLRFSSSHVQPYVGIILPTDDQFDVLVFAVGIAGPL